MATTIKRRILELPVTSGTVLGVSVLRGYARLCDLSLISRADIYDPKTNPNGTQRDLSPKHAKDAYDYVRSKEIGFWPEIVLCVRQGDVIGFKKEANHNGFGTLRIDLGKIERLSSDGDIAISRLDGNHRLHYADGKTDGYPAIEKLVSFCLATELDLDEEILLFRDINNNQRRMNTSHLDNIETRLSGNNSLKREALDLYIAKKLSDDKESPFHGRVYDGGKKVASSLVPLRTLRSGIQYMMSRPTKLTALPDADAKYKVIKNYFGAVRRWVPEAWSEPKKYLVLRGAGLWGICFLGAEVIDRALSKGQFQSDSMLKILRSGKTWDWTNDGDFQGYSGRGGATKIRDAIVAELSDESGSSLRDLYKKIMDE